MSYDHLNKNVIYRHMMIVTSIEPFHCTMIHKFLVSEGHGAPLINTLC